jgi:hypothetical protein
MGRDRNQDVVGQGSELGRRLRREAGRGRPAFSPALQSRIVAAVAVDPGPSRRGPRAAGPATLVGCVAAGCLAVAVCLAGGRDARPPGDESARFVSAAAFLEPPRLEHLPLPDEIGADLLAGTAAIAAEAVGLPRWNDLCDAGAALVGAEFVGPGPVTR